ncbi:MAG: HIT family protein [Actinomycetaceae bacterium]|nr:HIT family protein [Arcanobacterium sp.]MDD7505259.1 HIT family protein [Actinomycetaceae bacterium]MDY6144022.1 HIT family protein [Arcanobacterium sp.]
MSVFSQIITGSLPGRFVWADDVCVAFATIEPAQPGHVLVVPREETDVYYDVPPHVFARMANVAQIIGKAQVKAFHTPRAVLSILGFDVPHTHIHVIPAPDQESVRTVGAKAASDSELDSAMSALRQALIDLGYGENVPPDMSSPRLSA